jgi:hypothetical protein
MMKRWAGVPRFGDPSDKLDPSQPCPAGKAGVAVPGRAAAR